MEANTEWIIREIIESDNKELENILRSVMIEFKVPKRGTALCDPELNKMSDAYNRSKSIYFIIERVVYLIKFFYYNWILLLILQ